MWHGMTNALAMSDDCTCWFDAQRRPRSKKFGRALERALRAHSITSVRPPHGAPNLNAHVERFIETVQTKCFDRFIVMGRATSTTSSPSTSGKATGSAHTLPSTTGRQSVCQLRRGWQNAEVP